MPPVTRDSKGSPLNTTGRIYEQNQRKLAKLRQAEEEAQRPLSEQQREEAFHAGFDAGIETVKRFLLKLSDEGDEAVLDFVDDLRAEAA